MLTKCQGLKGKLGETVAGATQLDVMLASCTGLVQSYSAGLVPADGFAFCLMSHPTLGFNSCQLTSAGPVYTQLDRDFPSKLHVDTVAPSNNVALL